MLVSGRDDRARAWARAQGGASGLGLLEAEAPPPEPGQAWVNLPATQPPGLRVWLTKPVQLPDGYGVVYQVSGSTQAAPLFAGQPLFGDPMRFVVGELLGSAAAVDGWLGLVPGTTAIGAGPGRLWAIQGTFRGQTPSAVLAQVAALLSYCGPAYTAVFPTGEVFAFTAWVARANCRISSAEIVTDPAGIVGNGTNWSLNYWCVVRQGRLS